MTTGMTVAERWYEVGRRVENGDSFTAAEWGVFGGWKLTPFEFAAAFNEALSLDEDDDYATAASILAYFLALEAEDAATQDAEPYPQTADVVAEEEPIQVSQMERAGVGQAAFNGYLTKILDHKPERRSSWNAKLADGLRKWAHWLEKRF